MIYCSYDLDNFYVVVMTLIYGRFHHHCHHYHQWPLPNGRLAASISNITPGLQVYSLSFDLDIW